MKARQSLLIATVFAAGIAAGGATATLISPARADTINWQEIAKEPGFRVAVVEIINSCIVENSIIYCN
jgi:hypothetical protein